MLHIHQFGLKQDADDNTIDDTRLKSHEKETHRFTTLNKQNFKRGMDSHTNTLLNTQHINLNIKCSQSI